MDTSLVLYALEQDLHDRPRTTGLLVLSDHESQYVSLRYTTRPAEAGAAPCVGSGGVASGYAPAECVIWLFKTEVISRQGPARGLDPVKYKMLAWVLWFNQVRLPSTLGFLPLRSF